MMSHLLCGLSKERLLSGGDAVSSSLCNLIVGLVAACCSFGLSDFRDLRALTADVVATFLSFLVVT